MKIIVSLIILLLSATASYSSTPLLEEANSYFQQAVDLDDASSAAPLLDKALLRYEQIYRDHPSGRLAYNIGNTYYKLGNKAMALVFYKRAEKQIPSDENLRHNMEVVRQELQLQATTPKTTANWQDAIPRPSQNQLLGLYILFWLSAGFSYLKKKSIILPVILLTLCLAGTTILGMERLKAPTKEGVIIQPETIGRQGNGRSFEPSFSAPLTVGSEFEVLEKRGYWLRIKLQQGECWIPARSCEIV